MAVARQTQIIGASHSWEDAVPNALERANRTLRNITGIEVLKENGRRERAHRGVSRDVARDVRARGDVNAGDRMTALDAAFFNLERTGQLLRRLRVDRGGPLDFSRLLDDVASRLHLIRAARSAWCRAVRHRAPRGKRRRPSTSAIT
jgi:flavin-binding protein dodecin